METYFNRIIEEELVKTIAERRKIIVLYGARQTGKTWLSRKIIERTGWRWLEFNGDNPEDQDLLFRPTMNRLIDITGGYDAIFVDEAQRIPEIGLTVKRLYDSNPKRQILITGSSSIGIGDSISEPLTGRTRKYTLYPISVSEFASTVGPISAERHLETFLVLGSYPELFSLENREEKISHLKELTASYLYKDILELSSIKNHRKIRYLLRLLAYQVGSEVSYTELATKLSMSTDTVISYIDLLEKGFVVFRLGPWSRNLRKELTKKQKVYFFDNGIRNALINDFKHLESRNDQGALWENFLISERIKRNAYRNSHAESWFWRLQTGAEIDYLEYADDLISAFEFKWGTKGAKAPRSFSEAYPNHQFTAVTRDNWFDFVC